MLKFTEINGVIELVSATPAGQRIVFGLVALIPLIAPYELLIRPQWNVWWHPAFFFMLAIALGAMAVSAFFLFAALAGLEQRMKFDSPSRLFSYWRRAPIVPPRSQSWPLASIARVEAVVQTWSDGPDSYSVRVVMDDGQQLTMATIKSKGEVDHYVARLNKLLDSVSS